MKLRWGEGRGFRVWHCDRMRRLYGVLWVDDEEMQWARRDGPHEIVENERLIEIDLDRGLVLINPPQPQGDARWTRTSPMQS